MQFSVIIPTRNRPGRLAACLESFTALDYPAGDWELIVVNDGGADSFTAVTGHLKQSLPLRLVSIAHAGPAAARNAGARLASGDFLAFTDDDCRVAPDWLRRFAQGFAETSMDALGGCALNPFPDNKAARASKYMVDFLYDHMRDENSGAALFLVSNNAAYRRSVYESIGGFDETFPLAAAEDMEFSYRLLASGYRQSYYPEATVWHHHQLTWWGHIRQQFRYGRGGYYFLQAIKQAHHKKHFTPNIPRSFYIPLGRSLWRARLPVSMWLLVSVAQIAYRAGQFYQRLRHAGERVAEFRYVLRGSADGQ